SSHQLAAARALTPSYTPLSRSALCAVRREPDDPATRLAQRLPLVRRLDPVVDRVPDHVDQRVGDEIDHVAVDLRLLGGGHEDDELAATPRDIARQPGHPLERRRGRDHAHRDRQVLQLAKDLPGVRYVPRRHVVLLDVLDDHRVRDDELTDHVDQRIETVRPDPDPGAAAAPPPAVPAVTAVGGAVVGTAAVVPA